jgi:hypothetical protein
VPVETQLDGCIRRNATPFRVQVTVRALTVSRIRRDQSKWRPRGGRLSRADVAAQAGERARDQLSEYS